MSNFDRIKREFQACIESANRSPVIQRMARGDVGLQHYQSLMRQISHHARENPQLQTLATIYFRGTQRRVISAFYRHAISEIGHDQLALNDLAATGFKDVADVPFQNPLPATCALTAFAFYQIQNWNPVGYLGYLAFLELMPTQQGTSYKAMFLRVGVPENAFTFIDDHICVDVGHNKAMERYLDELVTNEADMESVLYALRTTAYLYERMVESAFAWADTPFDFGVSHEELSRRERPRFKQAVEADDVGSHAAAV